jgi:ATP-dependent 26S proteasome regulatory subunit
MKKIYSYYEDIQVLRAYIKQRKSIITDAIAEPDLIDRMVIMRYMFLNFKDRMSILSIKFKLMLLWVEVHLHAITDSDKFFLFMYFAVGIALYIAVMVVYNLLR